MGTAYCQGQTQAQLTAPEPQSLPQLQLHHPIHIKPPQPIARLTNIQDHIQTLHTSTRRERKTLKRGHPKKRNASESVEHVLVSALKGLGSSLSVGKKEREGTRKRSIRSAYKYSLAKESESVERMSAKKLDDFLRKQKDFVEKKRRSIDKIRKLLEMQYQKENPHRPSLNQTTNEITKNRIPMRKRPQANITNPLKQRPQNLAVVRSSQSLSKHPPPQYLPQSLKTYMTFSSNYSSNPKLSQKQLLLEFSSCLSRLLLNPNQNISYLLFVNIMRQMHMVTQPNSVDNGVFVAERELLHKAWGWITKSEDINKDCTERRLRGFVLALYGFVGDRGCSPSKIKRDEKEETHSSSQREEFTEEEAATVCQQFQQFKATRQRIMGMIRQNKPKEEFKKNEVKPPKKSIAARKWIQQSKQEIKQPKQQIKIDLSKHQKSQKLLKKITSNPILQQPEQTKLKKSLPQATSLQILQTFHPNANNTGDSQTTNKTILQIDIELGGRNETIRVSQGDNPNEVAANFVKQFGLPLALKDRLSSLITSGLAKVYEQQSQNPNNHQH